MLDEHRSGTKGPNRTASKLMFLTCVRFRTKAPIFEFPRFRSAAALPWNPAADPTVPGRKAARMGAAGRAWVEERWRCSSVARTAAFRPPFSWSINFLYNRPLTRLDDIGSVVALDVAIVTQPRDSR